MVVLDLAASLSQSITVRGQIPRLVLQVKTLDWRPFGSSQSVTSRTVLGSLVLHIEILQKPRMGAATKNLALAALGRGDAGGGYGCAGDA